MGYFYFLYTLTAQQRPWIFSKQCVFLSSSGFAWVSMNNGHISFVPLVGTWIHYLFIQQLFTESFSEPGTMPGAGGYREGPCLCVLPFHLWAVGLEMQWWEGSLAEVNLTLSPVSQHRGAV